jgi:hypothetical protein
VGERLGDAPADGDGTTAAIIVAIKAKTAALKGRPRAADSGLAVFGHDDVDIIHVGARTDDPAHGLESRYSSAWAAPRFYLLRNQ